MCRFLIAVGGYPPEDALEDFVAVSRRDRTTGWSHGSGWGMLWLRRGEVGVYRSVRAIWESFVPPPRGYDIYVLHSRLASVGSVAIENTHPILRGGFAIVHNGTLDKQGFAAELKRRGIDVKTTGDTDTELLLSAFVELGSNEKAAREVAEIAKKYIDRGEPLLNFAIVDLNEAQVYLYTYRLVEHPHFVPQISKGSPILISSEPVGRDSWVPIPNDTLLTLRT